MQEINVTFLTSLLLSLCLFWSTGCGSQMVCSFILSCLLAFCSITDHMMVPLSHHTVSTEYGCELEKDGGKREILVPNVNLLESRS